MENKSKNLTAVIVILIAIIAVLGAISAYNFLTVVEKEETTATVIINFGNGTENSRTFEDITTENNTVFGFLIEAADEGGFSIDTKYYSGMGIFINEIAGVQHGTDIPGIDDEDQRWWQYYVNDELGPVAADRQKVNDNDIIEWRFEIPSW